MNRIGVLTSGGDAPGMNACIRAIVRASLAHGLEVSGINHGYAGLIEGDVLPLDRRAVTNIIHTGGTILGCSRSEEFRTKEGRAKAIRVLRERGIDGLILIGGDGSFRGGALLEEESGIPVVGVPGTIDNDVYGTDSTIGFDTAVATALDAIDKIRDTARSHERLFFVEVMGRNTGFIALATAIAGGAEEMVIPELEESTEELCRRLEASFSWGKRSAIVIVAEGDRVGRSIRIADEVSKRVGIESRVVILGHTQRGGAPTAHDRILASKLGVGAVEALLAGETGRMVGEVNHEIVTTPLAETYGRKRELEDVGLVWLFRLLSS